MSIQKRAHFEKMIANKDCMSPLKRGQSAESLYKMKKHLKKKSLK